MTLHIKKIKGIRQEKEKACAADASYNIQTERTPKTNLDVNMKIT